MFQSVRKQRQRDVNLFLHWCIVVWIRSFECSERINKFQLVFVEFVRTERR